MIRITESDDSRIIEEAKYAGHPMSISYGELESNMRIEEFYNDGGHGENWCFR